MLTGAAVGCSLLLAAGSAHSGVNTSPCPRNAIVVEPGALTQVTVDLAGDGAAFCLRNGIHRAVPVRPRPKQRLYGEGNRIWSNNIYGFDPGWEAGGVKIAESDGVTFRGNHVHDNKGRGLWCDGDCRNVVYEENLVENNERNGIFHEISFNAVVRNNQLRHNNREESGWFWGAEILLAGSQDVEVSGNAFVIAEGICGIMLIDQGRRDNGPLYKTRNNTIQGNEMTFEGGACASGVSDTKPDHENYAIIPDGNNRFDGNTYRVARPSEPGRFVWGHEVTDWDGFRRKGLEKNGRLVPY